MKELTGEGSRLKGGTLRLEHSAPGDRRRSSRWRNARAASCEAWVACGPQVAPAKSVTCGAANSNCNLQPGAGVGVVGCGRMLGELGEDQEMSRCARILRDRRRIRANRTAAALKKTLKDHNRAEGSPRLDCAAASVGSSDVDHRSRNGTATHDLAETVEATTHGEAVTSPSSTSAPR